MTRGYGFDREYMLHIAAIPSDYEFDLYVRIYTSRQIDEFVPLNGEVATKNFKNGRDQIKRFATVCKLTAENPDCAYLMEDPGTVLYQLDLVKVT